MYAPFVPAVAAAMSRATRQMKSPPSPGPSEKGRPRAEPLLREPGVGRGHLPAAIRASISWGAAAL